MAIRLLQIPVPSVFIDEARSPDREDGLILEHLTRYCAKFEPLPAITVVVEGRMARVLRGHKYLLASRMLGRPTIRAVIAGAPAPQDIAAFAAHVGAEVLDWETIRAVEEREPSPEGWHVFFFARPLSPGEKNAFDARVAPLFHEGIEVKHDDEGPVAEFEAKTPATDMVWIAAYRDALAAFSREHVPVVSYQGRRFEAPASGACP